MKKFFAILMTLALMLSLAVPAMAATVSNETTGHSYDAYQVFAGTQAVEEIALGDITWGTGVDGAKLLEQLKKDYDYFDDCADAAAVAEVLEGKHNDCPEAKALANAAADNLTANYTEIAAGADSVELATGYWLLVDVTNVGEGDARNNALLQVTNHPIEISKKYTVPAVNKTIKDAGEATDAGINDTVTFVLNATLPNNVSDYDTYKVVFHDTMSAGLTYTNNVTITIDGKSTTGFDTPITGEDENGNTTITISADDVKYLGAGDGSVIVVEYTALVNSKAVIGSAGNPNEVYLEYSNDPNWNGTPEKEPTGNTPKDEVIVFVYELDVNKTNGSGSTLADAEFILLNSDNSKIAKVADGKLVEWVAISNVTENADGTYPVEYTLKSGNDGKFVIAGLDAGIYYLKETKAPAGYNKLTEKIKIEIAATIIADENAQSLDTLTIAINDGASASGTTNDDGDLTGIVETTVINNAGSTLPETGGMGTTIFYTVGGVMVVAAVVLLITKKRMSAEG